jgi:hypothetical protein
MNEVLLQYPKGYKQRKTINMRTIHGIPWYYLSQTRRNHTLKFEVLRCFLYTQNPDLKPYISVTQNMGSLHSGFQRMEMKWEPQV